ncbi:MAG: nucleotide-binding protein, PIN domain-containing protein [Acidimicrobiales bacterium]|nr:MAG: nucleotide-binding protein, PIN domain-containing protein [Acidimicrobiales bacterium]
MIVVADASVLVAELLRRRGRELFAHPDLSVVVPEEQWNETEHELKRRLGILVDQGKLNAKDAQLLLEAVLKLVDDRIVEVIPHSFYAPKEAVARRRIPRDPNDWPPVALALTLDVGILTGDHDFLGCGCPTWTVETLHQELELDPAPGT